MKYRMTLLGVVIATTPAAAQVDYRKLDRGRPGAIEDAYPIERYGFELMGGYRLSRIGPGRAQQLFEPELGYGIGRGLGIAVSAPFAVTDREGGPGSGVAGLRLSAKYNLSTERPGLPGLGLRLDGLLPVGALGGDGMAAAAHLLATRSLGRNRVHLNAGFGLNRPRGAAGAEAMSQWSAGVAVDRTFIRSSTLVILEMAVARGWEGAKAEWSAGLGLRRQLTPVVVLDAGIGIGEPSLTLGFSHAFGFAGLIPGGAR